MKQPQYRSPKAMFWATQLSSLPFELAFFIAVGYWGDQKFGTKPWLMLAGALFGMLVASWHLWQLIKAMDKDFKQEKK